MAVLMMGRPRQGTVGERARSVHVFKVGSAMRPAWLKALCGCRFHEPDLEFLGEVVGMPCEICLSRTPGPHDEPTDAAAVLSGLRGFDRIEVLLPEIADPGSATGEAERPA